jgi:hypothetical protein
MHAAMSFRLPPTPIGRTAAGDPVIHSENDGSNSKLKSIPLPAVYTNRSGIRQWPALPDVRRNIMKYQEE